MPRPSPDHGEEGYATAAATVISLALAMTASAVTALSIAEARAAKSDMERTQAVAQLDAGALQAAWAITANSRPGRLRWSLAVPGGRVQILAELEADKFSIEEAIDGRSDMMRRMGVADQAALAARLRAELSSPVPKMLADLDGAPLWRACAESTLSYFGQGRGLSAAASAPNRDGLRPHAGEVWRVQVSAGGWTEDRLVRITGNSTRPGLVIQRRLRPKTTGGQSCAELMSA